MTVRGNTLTAVGVGEVTLAIGYTTTVGSKVITYFDDPITVTLTEAETPPSDETPDETGPEGETPGGDTSDGSGTQPKVDHSKCEANFFQRIWNAICNFFIKLFGGKEKCVCGEELY